MSIPTDIKALTELFRELGAQSPESWASSQVNEGFNQLHRFLFLRQAWSRVISENDDTWIEDNIATATTHPDQPFAGIGHALGRMLSAGVAREDIVDLARGMQGQLLFDICYLLGDPSLPDSSVDEVGWTLVETDEDYAPTLNAIEGLHESVLDTDPTGREMRPRTAAA
ncbi:hypothetical protein [Viridibacterium curvum]|uniref:Uncharacterized protein n=1 Tax=Viridibacterium curvum TaxID=1101404 RepID=A0ABP9QJK0_9RHOO